MFDAKSFLFDYRIEFREGGKDWQPGWIQINCPFCDDPHYHGGFNIASEYYNCWRCGFKSLANIIQKLTNIDFKKAKGIIRKYQSQTLDVQKREKGTAKECKLPTGIKPLNDYAKLYLLNRLFVPTELERIWRIKSTNNIGRYKFRIIIPIFVDGELVSYTARDYTNMQEERYKACNIDDEVIHHKHIAYGIDYVKDETCIIVEGPTDVWRIGAGAICLFGTTYTNEQLLFLKERVKYGIVVFDAEREATNAGERLIDDLNSLGLDFSQVVLEKNDPGNLNESQVKELKSIVFK